MSRRTADLSPDLLLRAYRAGFFPMAEGRHTRRLYWLDPDDRGILPLDGFHLPRRLLRTALSARFTVTADMAFAAVLAGCASPAPGREETWINDEIARAFGDLFALGHAHSIECWHDGALVGGLYGVSIGGAFFGESMFNRARDASKVALAHLVARLRLGGYGLLDAQFLTDHLARFGAIAVPKQQYRALLTAALARPAAWIAAPPAAQLAAALRSLASAA